MLALWPLCGTCIFQVRMLFKTISRLYYHPLVTNYSVALASLTMCAKHSACIFIKLSEDFSSVGFRFVRNQPKLLATLLCHLPIYKD